MPINTQTDLEKINAAGGEVVVTPAVFDVEKIGYFTIRLSSDAESAKLDFATMAMFFKQKDYIQSYWREHKHGPPTILAPVSFQELFIELVDMSKLHIDGVAIPLPAGGTLSLEIIDVAAARDLDYPIQEESQDFDPYFVFKIPAGADGADGADGAPGAVGPAGADGAPGVCDCPDGGGSGPDGGGSGPPGGDGGGSGPDNEPNPDGLDKIVYVSGCPDPILNFPFCSASFSFADADLRAAITAAASGTGNFNPATEDLISVVLDWKGAAYAGIAELTVGGEYDYTGPHSNLARILSIKDAEENTYIVPHTVEQFGLEGVLVVAGYHYDGTTGLRMMPVANPIPLNGQMSTYPILESANCHTPADETDPAWLRCCLRQFVKRARPVAACHDMPLYQLFDREHYQDNPTPQANPQNQAGWSSDAGDAYAVTSPFNSKVDTIPFHPPTAGNANAHLQFNCIIGDGAAATLHLFRVDHYDEGVTMNISTTTSENVYTQFTESFDMVPDNCYILEYHRNEEHFVNCYLMAVQWV